MAKRAKALVEYGELCLCGFHIILLFAFRMASILSQITKMTLQAQDKLLLVDKLDDTLIHLDSSLSDILTLKGKSWLSTFKFITMRSTV